MVTTTQMLISLILFFLFPLCSSIPSATILAAAGALANSGYVTMALILEFGASSILRPSSSLTIFTPNDTFFAQSGQPSLSLLQFHFSPLSFSFSSLKSLTPGTRIPTLFTNHSLVVTSDGDLVSLNGVKINGSAIYDDMSLMIFGIDGFLDPDYNFSVRVNERPNQNLLCPVIAGGSFYLFEEANRVLRSKGYSIMASFLDLQLAEFQYQMALTIFAPVDQVMGDLMGDFIEYRSIFLRHVVPCRISWNDLVTFDDAIMLPTYLKGFAITVKKNGKVLMLNGVEVNAPNMYSSDWLVIHGLHGSLAVPWRSRPAAPDLLCVDLSNGKKIAVDLQVIKILVPFSILFLFIFL